MTVRRALLVGAAIVALGAAALAGACGSEDVPAPPEGAPTPLPTSAAPDGPLLTGPANRFAPAIEEVPPFLAIDAQETFPVGRDGFLVLGPFRDTVEGRRLLDSWGYDSGYRIQFAPDGLLAGVMLGRYYATVETYLLPNQASARQAFAKYREQGELPGGVDRLEIGDGIGDERAAWRLRQGTVGETNVAAVYHRLVLRRGNLVAVVTTFAAEPFASSEPVLLLSRIIDERATGTRPAPTPTPFPTRSGGTGP